MRRAVSTTDNQEEAVQGMTLPRCSYNQCYNFPLHVAAVFRHADFDGFAVSETTQPATNSVYGSSPMGWAAIS